MNYEELSRKLLDENVEKWPALYQNLAAKSSGPTSQADANIKATIAKSADGTIATEKVTPVTSLPKGKSKMKRTLVLSAAALFTIVAGVAVFFHLQSGQDNQPGGIIQIIKGTAKLNEGKLLADGSYEATKESKLSTQTIPETGFLFKVNQRLKTDSDSAAQLLFFKGARVRIGSDAEVILQQSQAVSGADKKLLSKKVNLNLEGQLYYQSERLEPEQDFSVHTPTAVASVRGTEFLLSSSKQITVLDVHEGRVEFKAKTGDASAIVTAGQRATIDGNGRLQVNKQPFKANLQLQRFNRTDPVFKKFGAGPLDEDLELTSDKEIKNYLMRGQPIQHSTVLVIRYGSTPMSMRRVTPLAASFVCSVESTKCPVNAT